MSSSRRGASFAGDKHTAGDQLYEWSDGRLEVAAVDTADTTCGATLGDMHAGSVTFHGPIPEITGGALGHIASAVSQDGSRVFFESPDPWAEVETEIYSEGRCQQPTDLYVRENGETIDISAPPPASPIAATLASSGRHRTARRSSSPAQQQLTPDKTNTNPDLYEYDVETTRSRACRSGPPGYDDANVQSASHLLTARMSTSSRRGSCTR